MQVLEPPSTQSYKTEEGHFIKTFLISTKKNEAGWQISKETGHQQVKTFEGKPFVIIPDELSSKEQKGHVFADTKESLIEEYKKHTHGIIESISSPYYYADGTDDYFYMANIKLSGSKAAAALMESGANTWIPFAVSPHIWANDGIEPHSDWEGISLSLVPQGAYGKDAVVSKYCKGETHACNTSLAAGLCDKEDASLAASITSLLSQNQINPIMAQVVEQSTPSFKFRNEQVSEQEQKLEQPKEDNSKAELERLTKALEAEQAKNKEKEDTVTRLVNKDKTNTLNKIFTTVKDEAVKESLIQKYLPADTDLLNGYTEDFIKHVVPSLVEEAKAQAEKELKDKTVEENKGKSKAGSLPKEPVSEESNSKAASIVPNKQNQVLKFDRLMRGLN